MESEYPYLTRKEAEAIGKNLVKKASPFVAGVSYLYGTQENHERFKSPYNAFRADAYDTLPISLGYFIWVELLQLQQQDHLLLVLLRLLLLQEELYIG